VRIVCAPDSFKESMTALEAAAAMADGIRRVRPDVECDVVPMADGGEGTVQAMIGGLDGQIVGASCHDPLLRPIQATYGYVASRRLAVIEMAAASGLALVAPADRDVATASTYGTGELIRDALDRGARLFVIGVGGSATNDAGAGLITALGARFLDENGNQLLPGGVALGNLGILDVSRLDPRLQECQFAVAVDVDNPLLGPQGATAVFGPQKGATTTDLMADLEYGLTCWADVVEATLGVEVRDMPGAGAGGGVGAALAAFIPRIRLRPGVDIVVSVVGLAERIKGADWVFTGEGRIDAQTLHGKTLMGVLECAVLAGVPVIMFGGSVDPEASVLLERGVSELVSIAVPGQSLPDALAAGPHNLTAAVMSVMGRLPRR